MPGAVIIERGARRQKLARLCQRTGVLPWLGALQSWRGDELRILAYHRVLESMEPDGFTFDLDLVSASQEAFRDQMKLVRRRFDPMRFEEVIDCIDRGRRLPARAVLVTFDDGYDDNYRLAFPVLRELDLSAMFFVSTGHIDSGLPYGYDWLVHMLCTAAVPRFRRPELGMDQEMPASLEGRRALAAVVLDRIKRLDDADQRGLIAGLEREWGMPSAQGDPDCTPMTWDQLREMRRGGMEVGAHSVNHTMLSKVSREEMLSEIDESASTLARELGEPAYAMSYPVGGTDAYNDVVIDAARSAGFRMACTYVTGTGNLRDGLLHALPRLPVERDMELRWFEAMLTLPRVFSYPFRARDL